MTKNRVTEILNIKYPIVQASMVWITSAELAAAVSNAGGLGMLGLNSGQTTLTSDPDETAERMRKEIRKTRELTDKPFAVQYMLPMGTEDKFSAKIYKVLREEKVKNLLILGMSMGGEAEQIKKIKEDGFTVIYRDTNPTVESAKIAEAAGADIIIATGYDEGGAMPKDSIGTMTIVPLIADAVNIPVLAAGGIVDNRQVKASMILGAEGVYVGTLFIASEECPASNKCKQDILNTKTIDLVEFKAIPTYWRCTPHQLALECYQMDQNGATAGEIHEKLGSGAIKTAMLDGDLDKGTNCVSNAIELIKTIRPCKEIIEDLMKGVNI